ncbi:cystatin-like [Salarias fasciatus]|uniref:Cystatin-like n=1 Tax=Salarias fasciatus TaxID=181472 RepID=A0A672IZF5_SALFA|nr:cystatin-like [Salarias fasciatus]XP_029940460.1 cystatin-like [Salarias fasciatus]
MPLPVSLLICLSVVHLCMGDQPVEEVITAKKVHHMGSWIETDPYAEDVQEAVQFAVQMFNTQSKSKKMFKLVSVENTKSQVTNRIGFKFDAVLVKTKCLKSENHDVNSCSLKKRHMKCHFRVSFDAHTRKHDVEKHKCKKQIEKA